MKTINKKIHGLRLMISNHKYICIFSIVIIALSISGYWWARSTEETASYFTWLREKVEVLLRVNLDFPQIDEAENMTGYSTKMGVDEKDFVE